MMSWFLIGWLVGGALERWGRGPYDDGGEVAVFERVVQGVRKLVDLGEGVLLVS